MYNQLSRPRHLFFLVDTMGILPMVSTVIVLN